MFGINLSCSTFEKISAKEIEKPLARLGVEPREFQRFLHLKALHVPAIVEAKPSDFESQKVGQIGHTFHGSGLDRAMGVAIIFVRGGTCFLKNVHPYQLQT